MGTILEMTNNQVVCVLLVKIVKEEEKKNEDEVVVVDCKVILSEFIPRNQVAQEVANWKLAQVEFMKEIGEY